MPHHLTDHLSPTPIHAPCAVRIGGHSFGFGAVFFAIATVTNGGVGGRPVVPASPCDRSSATNSVPEGRTQDGAEGRSLSPALGANVSTLDHAATANGKAQQDHG
ncbi:hypothetical protein N6H05_14815 [Sphingobium sp. WTD-1]|uniref:hypothetical protein n=1 Tax=Sphingobium sp. WTD-1 TaxID=2979467 RepID=UPI0024DEE49C|nr:hypothetical protein [Sphingobium sp. WTD-1]WIA54336.1 hypothetical protein N6H05_14815 [Sphingobium sp. WTD-1]